MVMKSKISPDGSIVKEDDGQWFDLPSHVDTFGIYWKKDHFLFLLVVIFVVTYGSLGFGGIGLFLLALALYTKYKRQSSSESPRWGMRKAVVSRPAEGSGFGANGANNGDIPPMM